jgi:formylglycine-generating enzyme required for sulfatase activity
MTYELKMAGCSRLLSIVMTVFAFTGCVKQLPLKEKNWTLPGLGMKFVYVAPGSFQMGSNTGSSYEKPVHRATISRGYWIGKYEVTQKEYQSIIGSNPSHFKGNNKPVEFVSWNDAVKFCQKLTARERAAGRLPSGYEYRLPTEAEWEFAARGGTKSRGFKYSGSDNINSVAWYYSNSSGKTHEVGLNSGNELGIYDMSGNVNEWCHDWRGSYSSSSQTDPIGPQTGSYRVFRGGNCYQYAWRSRATFRFMSSPGYTSTNLGFRIARAVQLNKQRSETGPDIVSKQKAEAKPSKAFSPKSNTSKSKPIKNKPWTLPGLSMKFVYVPPGSFSMGSNDSDSYSSERPVHRVIISRGYWIGKYEVTQSEYQLIIGSNPSKFKGSNNPVDKVSWNDAVKFCQKLTARERDDGRLPSGFEYRLPTDAEWEFAARGGTKSRGYKFSGSDNANNVAWYLSNSRGETHEVGTKSGNELGLYDMSGNVWEWCHDWRRSYNSSSLTDPMGPQTGTSRVYRGGSWVRSAASSRSTYRSSKQPGRARDDLGFRVVLARVLSKRSLNKPKTSRSIRRRNE